jgi:hypothetical protein
MSRCIYAKTKKKQAELTPPLFLMRLSHCLLLLPPLLLLLGGCAHQADKVAPSLQPLALAGRAVAQEVKGIKVVALTLPKTVEKERSAILEMATRAEAQLLLAKDLLTEASTEVQAITKQRDDYKADYLKAQQNNHAKDVRIWQLWAATIALSLWVFRKPLGNLIAWAARKAMGNPA